MILKKHTSNALCLDPGIGGTGYAMFESLRIRQEAPGMVCCHGVIKTQERQWQSGAEDLSGKLIGVLEALKPDIVAMEIPEMWQSSTSHSSAASGDLFKLCYLCGMFGEVARQFCMKSPILLRPTEWKGQLPKEVVIQRIKIIYPMLSVFSHDADAIGIGLHLQGRLIT